MGDQNSVTDINRRNMRILVSCIVVVTSMVGLSFAAVPLYQMFCAVTGFGGTTQVAGAAPEVILDREITVRFDTNVDPGLAWDFDTEQVTQRLRIGEVGLAFFTAGNFGSQDSAGVATFNVTPPDVGRYFNKIQCFCFDEQVLTAGEHVRMPVYYYVDPAIADAPRFDDLQTITLSYTFFPAELPDDATQEHVANDTNLGQRTP